MRNIYTFGRKPAQRNFTVKDLQDLKGSGRRLSMCNPANNAEIKACVEAGIDLLTVWDDQTESCRVHAPTHFVGTAMTWGNLPPMMRSCGMPSSAWRPVPTCITVIEATMWLKCWQEAIPVQVHMGLVPSISHWCGGLRAYGRTAEEAMRIHQTFKDFENAGAFACEIECVAEDCLRALNNKTSIVTISLGSGERRRRHFLVCCRHLR